MKYIELICKTEPSIPGNEILTAFLCDAGFDSFTENDNMLYAYINIDIFDEELILSLQNQLIENGISFTYQINEPEEINWNEEWERNFQPVSVNNDVVIRASFHEVSNNFKYDIIINPKMSFGTGHHETTWLMIENMLKEDFVNKSVLDMGCGTGVLGILASKMGASIVRGIDIEEWAFENTKENIELNQIKNFTVLKGGVEKIENMKFDIILANINKNILLQQIPSYSKCIDSKGVLYLSGFFLMDAEEIINFSQQFSFDNFQILEKNSWSFIKMIKK